MRISFLAKRWNQTTKISTGDAPYQGTLTVVSPIAWFEPATYEKNK